MITCYKCGKVISWEDSNIWKLCDECDWEELEERLYQEEIQNGY